MTASTSLTASPLSDLEALGQSVWFDNMRRALLSSGELERMMREEPRPPPQLIRSRRHRRARRTRC